MLHELTQIQYRQIGQRRVEWFSNHSLAYTGALHKPNLKWPPLLLSLAKNVEQFTGIAFNSALVNYYRDGASFIPWHCDDSKDHDNSKIASLSFDSTREFCIKDKMSKQIVLKLPLQHGSLALMLGDFQQHFLHSIPLSDCTGSRYNITLRVSVSPSVV